jgi:hypothetical protein
MAEESKAKKPLGGKSYKGQVAFFGLNAGRTCGSVVAGSASAGHPLYPIVGRYQIK